MSYINISVHAASWLLGFLILWKIPLCQKLSEDNSISSVWEGLSVIIPARNEERNLPKLLDSLAAQTIKPGEIIVVDDDSADSTPGIAESYGVKVISLKDLPRGWVGKSWACHNGTIKAEGSHLLFLDADTSLEEDGIEKIADCLRRQKGVISIQPYHRIKGLYENLSLFFNIILIAGIGAFTPFSKKPIGAFGPCLLCSLDDYKKIGGHKGIRGRVMEDIEMGKKFIRQGIKVNCMGGKGTIDFRMYPGGFMDVVRGWSKSFSSGARSTSIPVLIMVIAWIAGAVFPINALAESLASMDMDLIIISAVFYAAFSAQIYWMSYRVGSFSIFASIFYPIPLAFFIVVFLYSFIITFFKKSVTWKERKIRT